MTRTTLWRRVAAALAVGAIALVGGAGAAQAAPTIDPAQTGTLHVHKRLNPTGNLSAGNGLENPSAPGTPLAGVEFSVQRITTVDLMTTTGWAAAHGYAGDVSTVPAASLGTAVTRTTVAGTGLATFPDLAIGAYLVTENLTAAQVADGITPAAPFVVTVPMTHPTDLDTWIYDVHVYPKNLQSTVSKTVDDGPGTTYRVGDLIDWTISSPVPAQATTSFSFKDELVQHLTIPTPLAVNVVVTLGGTDLVAADYALTYDAAGDNTLWVRLTPAGLGKVNAVVGTPAVVAVTLTTEVVSLPADGIVENSATVFPNASLPETGPGVTTPPVESKFGEINLRKIVHGTSTPLAGAEFKVFRSQADAVAYAADAAANAALPLQAYQNGAGALTDTFVTAADGTVSVTGLRASNWQDGAILMTPADFQNYWILETRAPAGYELSTAPLGPVSVLFDAAAPTVLPYGDLTVPNVAKPELPLTGGQIATGVFVLLGGLVLAGGTLLVVRARRQGAEG